MQKRSNLLLSSVLVKRSKPSRTVERMLFNQMKATEVQQKRYERRFKLDCLIICSFDIQKSSFCESSFVGCSFEWQFNKRSQSLLALRVNRVNLLQPRPRLWRTTPSRLWRTTPSRLWTTPPSRPNSAGKRWKYFMQCSIGTMLFPSTTTDQMFGQLFVDNLRSR